MSSAAARAATVTVAKPPRSDGGGRVSESQLLARGGMPRWPVCAWRPHRRGLPEGVGIPVGAFVTSRPQVLQRVRQALMGTGRLKWNGVTRFDARVWEALCATGYVSGESLREDGSGDEWAVHVFGISEGQREVDAMEELLASGDVRYVPNVRIGSPACYVDTKSRHEGCSGREPELRSWSPLIPEDELERTRRKRAEDERASRAPRGQSPPRWRPAAHTALAAAVDGEGDAGSSSTDGFTSSTDGFTSSTDGFTFSELFAGIGGFGVALRSLGGTPVFASELCGRARRTYLVHHAGSWRDDVSNYPDASPNPDASPRRTPPLICCGDITDVCETLVPPHDVLTGGFPCQSFSRRGDMLGLDDPRGQLFREILRVLVAAEPRAFVLENVEGLVTMDGGETMAEIVAALESVGYAVRTRVLDARGWVPQSRKRVFFVGFRSDLRAAREDGVFAWPEEPSDCGGTVDDVLEDERGEAAARCEVSEYQMDRAAAFFRRQQGSGTHTPTDPPHAGYLFPTDGVARTLCASYRKSSVYNAELVPPVGNDGGDESGSVRTRPRYYTVRECARLQGFPETFYPDPERGYHELGNSVCVPLVRAIGEEVLRALEAS